MTMQLSAAFLLVTMVGGEFTLMRTPKPPIVIRATGQVAKEVTIGKPLPQRSAFGLGRGDVLSFLDAKGVRILKGPGVLANGLFTPTGPSGSDGTRTMAVTDSSEAVERAQPPVSRTRGFSLTRPAATPRDGAKPATASAVTASPTGRPRGPRDLTDTDWLVDISETSVCLPEGTQPAFYRETAEAQAEVRVEGEQVSAAFVWPIRQHIAPWPLPVKPGQSYTLSIGDRKKRVSVAALATAEPTADQPLGVSKSCAPQVQLNAQVREELALWRNAVEDLTGSE